MHAMFSAADILAKDTCLKRRSHTRRPGGCSPRKSKRNCARMPFRAGTQPSARIVDGKATFQAESLDADYNCHPINKLQADRYGQWSAGLRILSCPILLRRPQVVNCTGGSRCRPLPSSKAVVIRPPTLFWLIHRSLTHSIPVFQLIIETGGKGHGDE
jgi:hypothetical protein